MDNLAAGFYYETCGIFVVLIEMPSFTSDTDIWDGLRAGERAAMLALYEAHYVGLTNFGVKMTGNQALTKDCITQVLLRLWDNRKKLPPVQNIRSYLLTCMKHEVLKEWQTDATRLAKYQQLQNGQEPEPSYEQYLIALQSDVEVRETLRRAMEQLTEREKELLNLRFFENKDYDEIAADCNITKRTAYNIIFTALKTLKTEMLVKGKSKLSIVRAVSVLFMCLLQ